MRCTRELGEVELKKNLCRFVDDCFYDFHIVTTLGLMNLKKSGLLHIRKVQIRALCILGL